MGSTLLLIGGPAGAGKSTVVRSLTQSLGASAFRPHEAFLAIASERGVPPENAFDLRRVKEADVWARYGDWVESSPMTVADIHYAIQPRRDSAAAIGADPREDHWPRESYVAAMTPEFLGYLASRGIRIGLVLLTAQPEELVRRLMVRDGTRARSLNPERMAEELHAERRHFLALATAAGVPRLTLADVTFDSFEPSPVLRRFVAGFIEKQHP